MLYYIKPKVKIQNQGYAIQRWLVYNIWDSSGTVVVIKLRRTSALCYITKKFVM